MKVTSIEDVNTNESAPVVEKTLPKKAFSVVKGTDNEWKVVSISFDPVTGEVGPLVVEKSDPYKAIAIESFKIHVAQTGMLS